MIDETNPTDLIAQFITHILCLFMGVALGACLANDYWRQVLVDKGYAEWRVIKGIKEVEFTWKENIKK